MEWLKCDTEEKVLKENYGTLKNLIKSIKIDNKDLFSNYESKDKNIGDMIKITSNSWKGITEKIIIFKEVIKSLNINIYGENNAYKNSYLKNNEDGKNVEEKENFFKSEEAKIIFYLLEIDGLKRAKALNITRMQYSNKKEAKKWRDNIAKKIHPDICKHKEAARAISKLNQLYEEMTCYE